MSQAFHGGGIRHAAEQFGLPPDSFVDFSSNMNVLAPEIAADDWGRWIREVHRYPEPTDLSRQLADFYDVRSEHVLPTAGAIEALYLCARLFSGCRIAVVEPAFSDYSRAFSAIPCSIDRILLTQDLWASSSQVWADRLAPFDVVVLGNPNNPTGTFRRLAELAALFDRRWARPKHWIIDEAFIEFVTGSEHETLLGRLADYPALIVLRSLTKSWRIPGLRFGFLATAGPMADLQRMQPPWSVNSLVHAWTREFLRKERRSEYLTSLRRLAKLRGDFEANLRRVPGITVYPSAANFLLLELTDPSLGADQIHFALGSRGILVRTCDSFYGMPKGRFLRVAIRTASENEQLVNLLSVICAAGQELPGSVNISRHSVR